MTIQDQIVDTMKTAMKAGDKELLSLMRVTVSEFNRQGKILDDTASLQVIKKLHKNAVEVGNEYEQKIFEKYLPKTLNEEDSIVIIQDIISSNNITNVKQMGMVMGKIKQHEKGKLIDMRLAAKLIRDLINEKN